jgi:hypothetical protein
VSWYSRELVKCYRCGQSFSTPIDLSEHHRAGCPFPVRHSDGGIPAKVGTGPLEVVYTKRILVMLKPMTFKRHDGTKFTGIIDRCNKECIFIALH